MKNKQEREGTEGTTGSFLWDRKDHWWVSVDF